MKILVCISNVPDTTTKITFNSNNTEFNTSGVQFILNPYDELALARAIELTEGGKGSVTVVNVGLADTEPTIRKALAIGADDAIRINAAPANAYFVAQQIAKIAKVIRTSESTSMTFADFRGRTCSGSITTGAIVVISSGSGSGSGSGGDSASTGS